MNESIFDKLDFGPLKPILDNDDITDISYCNGGQIWIRSLTQGSIRIEIPECGGAGTDDGAFWQYCTKAADAEPVHEQPAAAHVRQQQEPQHHHGAGQAAGRVEAVHHDGQRLP